MQFDLWRRSRALGFPLVVAVLLFSVTNVALAAYKELLTGQGGVSVPLQQVVRTERVRGPVSISVPVAYVFGIGSDRSAYYCSPSIRAANSSNYPIEELIVGIAYTNDRGQPAGSSITHYANIKVGRDDTHYFYQLATQDCRGLTGEVTILRCMYSTGEDCMQQTLVSPFGAIPLRMKPR